MYIFIACFSKYCECRDDMLKCKYLLVQGSNYENHVVQMAPAVQELSQLESKAQLLYLKRHFGKEIRYRN
jgi:hypothetical protein